MPKSWQVKAIGNLASVSYGFTAKASHENVGPRFLRITDIQDGEVDWGSVPYCKVGPKDLEKHQLVTGDIVFARTGATTGKSFLLGDPPDAVAASYLIRLRLKSPEVSPQFVSFFFQTREYWDAIGAGLSGSAQGGFNASKLSELHIPVPPLREQERIVAILDEAFEGIATATANAERNLNNARELFQSVLQSTFEQKGEDWVETTLENLCSIKHGFAFKSAFFGGRGDYVVLTPGNFFEEGGYRDRGNKTKYYAGEVPKDYICSEGDFLIAMTEQAVGLLGSSIVVPETNIFLHNQRLGLVQLKDRVPWHNDFFFHQFNTKRFRARVQATASGAKVRHTSPKKLVSINVCYPPTVSAQEEIALRLNALAAETCRVEAIYQRKVAALGELKQSLLQRAFSGDL